jgi:general secretion pathway protein H
MRTLAVGSNQALTLATSSAALPPEEARPAWGGPALRRPVAARATSSAKGFTLLELLVVVAIIAIGTAGVSLALRDATSSTLEREAQRLAALLESGRAQSRAMGVPVQWRVTSEGFAFEGVPNNTLPTRWLSPDTAARAGNPLQLGPEPMIDPQVVVLTSTSEPDRVLRVATDGLRPFSVQTGETP